MVSSDVWFRGMSLLSVLLTILPVFLILGVGYLLARIGYLPDSIADALSTYAVKLAVPVLLFMAMFKLDFGQAFNGPMLVSFYVGAFACFAAGIVLSRMFWMRRPGESVAVGFCAVFSNTVLIGIPISQLAFGKDILTPVFGIIAFHASLLYTVGMVTMEFARRDGRALPDTLLAAARSVLGNPLMAGILLGIAANLVGLTLPDPVEAAMELIRATAIPVSLIGIGIALNRYAISEALAETLMVSVLALVVHPAIVFLLGAYVFELDLLFLKAAVVLAAMPPGMNVYIFATLYDRAVSLSASVLVIANMLAVLTIPAWLVLLKSL